MLSENNNLLSLIPYRMGTKWGFCNCNKEIIISCKYDETYPYYHGVAFVKKNKKYALLDTTGKNLTPFIYDHFGGFGLFENDVWSEDMIKVQKKNRYGTINKDGKRIIACKYYYIENYKNGVARVRKNWQWQFVDKSGKRKPELFDVPQEEIFEIGGTFSEGLIPVKKEKWGFANIQGEIVIPCVYQDVKNFSDELAAVREKTGWGFIDKNNNVIVEPRYNSVSPFKEKYAAVCNSKWGYINTSGEEIISCQYDGYYAHDFSEGAVCVSKNEKRGFIDRFGNVIIPFEHKYYEIEDKFSSGLLCFNQKKRKGFLNKENKIVFTHDYDWAETFKCGISRVRKNGYDGIIDTNGKLIMPFDYNTIGDISLGGTLMTLNYDVFPVELNKKHGIITNDNKVVVNCKYDSLNFSKYKDTGLIGVWDYQNKDYTHAKFKGYIDKKGTEYWED